MYAHQRNSIVEKVRFTYKYVCVPTRQDYLLFSAVIMTCVRRTYICTSFPQFSFGKWLMQYYACITSSNYVCGFQPSNLIQIFIEHRCCFACDKWLSAHVILEETLKSIFYLMNASQFNRRPKICNFLTAVHLFRRACSAMTNSNDISAHKMPSHTRFPNGLFLSNPTLLPPFFATYHLC